MFILKNKNDILNIKLDPITKVNNIIDFSDEVIGSNSETYFQKTFRYSIDNISFSEWMPLLTENLVNLNIINTEIYYFEFEYMKIGNEDIVFNNLELIVNENYSTVFKKVSQKCCKITQNATPTFINNKCDLKEVFDPSKLDNTFNITNQLNTWLSAQYGHCVKYYRVDPEENSKDVILKEYSLYDIVEVKNINVVVPGNEFPDNAPQFNPMDIDFLEMPWEIHISIKEWCRIFGDNLNPKRKDVLYFPINNRIYEIESSYLFKDFISRGSYWKLSLIKYQDKKNRDFIEDLEDEKINLENITLSVENAFGEERKEEIEQIVKEKQYEVIGTNEYDSTRLALSKTLEIKNESLSNNYTIFSKYNYYLNSASPEYVSPYDTVAVDYKLKPKLNINQNIAYTCWFKIDNYKEQSKKTISNIKPLNLDKAILEYNFSHGYLTGEILQISGINSINGLYEIEVLSDTELIIKKSISNSYLNLTNVSSQKQLVNNILYGYENKKGLIIGIVNTGIVIKLNEITYIFEYEFEINKWFSIILNISNLFDSLGVYVYDIINNSNKTTKLNLLFNKKTILAKTEFTNSETYKILGGTLSLTNIRLFGKNIEEEKHSNILTQYIVKDNHLAYLIDNAVPPLKLSRSKQNR